MNGNRTFSEIENAEITRTKWIKGKGETNNKEKRTWIGLRRDQDQATAETIKE